MPGLREPDAVARKRRRRGGPGRQRIIDRAPIVADLRRGLKRCEIARRWGISPRHVSNIAAEAGLRTGVPGRPDEWPECPAHLRADYATLKRYFRAAVARAMIERAEGLR